jgi:CRP-like cAMP-binding protein
LRAGQVEVWTPAGGNHSVATGGGVATRKRAVLASLKRGQSFGEKDILNREPRTECVTPTR